MKQDLRSARQDRIEAAAYELLADKGYGGTSMLSVAKRARCSNETLYNWYGDKLGLFRSLVTRNAEELKSLLQTVSPSDRPVLETLNTFGPLLLDVLLGDKAITLNRAAAADPTGELGMALSQAGRETIQPLVRKLFEAARERGELEFDNLEETVDLYLGVLIGDLQIRRVIGRMAVPGRRFVDDRAKLAYRVLLAVAQKP